MPEPTSGTNSSHTPETPSWRIGCSRPSQLLKSPLTRRPLACGAHTANAVPLDRSGGSVVDVHVGAEHPPQLLVAALVDQVQVDLAERRQVAVGVVDGVRRRAGVGDLEPVVGHLGHVEDAHPDAFVLVRERGAVGAVHHDDGLGQRPERAHGHRAVVDVRSQHAVRVAVAPLHDLVENGRVDGQHASRVATLGPGSCGCLLHDEARDAQRSVSRAIAPSGIGSQVGRLRAS